MVAKKSKVCKKCGKRKKIGQFDKQPATKDGLRTWCRGCVKVCNRDYYQTHKAKLLKKSNERYRANKEK